MIFASVLNEEHLMLDRLRRSSTRAVLVLFPTVLLAQTHPDVIRGRVTTDSNVALGGASIIVTRAPDRAIFNTTSAADGAYQIVIPNGTGDYLVNISLLGRQSFRKRVTRTGADTDFVVDARLPLAAQQLAPVTVQATSPKPTRGTGLGPFATEPGAAEKTIDGVSSAIAPDQQGDLTAAAATVPGLSVTGAGVSAFGLGAAQNSTTLGNMAFPGADVPREARTTTRVATSTYDPSRGWFSGVNTNVDLAGGNLLATRRLSLTVDAPAAQYTDAVSARLGQRYTNLRLNLGGDGPLTHDDRLFYSYGAQYAHRSASIATLGNADASLLRHAGVSGDSAARLLQIANASGIATGTGAAPFTIDDASFIARFDRAPFNWTTTPATPSPQTLALTTYGKWTRSTALSLGPTATRDHGGENWRALGMAQGLWSRYWGKDYLSEVRSALSYSRSRTTPSVELPDGRVLVGSNFPDVTGGYSTLQFGGNSALGLSNSQTTWETNAQTQWYARQKPDHRVKLTADARLDHYSLDAPANQFGTYTYASLADLAAARPSSFSRTLNSPTRTGGEWNAFVALGDQWQLGKSFQLMYGARLEGNVFTDAPAYNPEVERVFGARTDEAPGAVHVSPRVGFSWLRNRGGYGGGMVSPGGSFAFQPASALRGGIGEFRNLTSPLLLNAALVSTGLPGSATRITCIGSDVPTPDWTLFSSDPTTIPTQCASGASSTFADAAPAVQLFDRSYQTARAWRGNLNYVSQHKHFGYSVDGSFSLGLNQPGTVDLNLHDVPVFTTSDEGRPVLVPSSAIVAGSGVVSPVPARNDASFGRVVSNRSDLRTESRQMTFTLTPNLGGPSRWFGSIAYTLSSTRSLTRGFDGSTFGVPQSREWARSDFDARHQVLMQASYLKNGFAFSGFARAVSGLPYTPVIGGDVNGDGLINDRAFVFDPSRVSDAAFAQSLRSLRSGLSGGARHCLDAQQGGAAARNSCEGPWTTSLNMQVSASGSRLKLGNRIGQVALNLANPLGGLDQLLHGSDNLRGWGTSSAVDPVLYNVKGFDASASRFVYAVNPRFGNTDPALSTLRAPFRVTLDVQLNVGRTLAEQQLDRWVDPGRTRPGTKLTVADFKKRYQIAVPNPYPPVLQLADSLLLSRDQTEALQRTMTEYNRKVDSAWTALATYLVALPDHYDHAEALKRQEDVTGAVWEMTRLHVQENLRRILSPIQLTLLPGWASRFNTTTKPMNSVRIISGIRPT